MAIPVRVQRGVATFTGAPSSIETALDFTVDLTRAFVRITGTMHTSGGDDGGQAAASNVREFGCWPTLTATHVTIHRQPGTISDEVRAYWELWEYVGEDGGEHEWTVHATGLSTIPGGFDGSSTAVAAPARATKCVPIMLGQASSVGDTDAASLDCTVDWTIGSNLIQFRRGGTTGVSRIAWALVEFTGTAWAVGGPYYAIPAVGGGLTPVNVTVATVTDWATAFFFSTWRHTGNDVEQSSYMLYPDAADPTRIKGYAFNADDSGPTRAVIYTLRNASIAVAHFDADTTGEPLIASGTPGTAQSHTVDATAGGFDTMNLERAGMIGTALCINAADEDHPKGHLAYRITDVDEVEFWRALAGDSVMGAAQLVYFATATAGATVAVGNDVVAFSDSMALIGEEIVLGLSDTITVHDAAVVPSDVFAWPLTDIVRLTDSMALMVDEGTTTPPEIPEATFAFLRANWIVTVRVATAWLTDIVRAGHSDTTHRNEERRGLLDRPRRTLYALLQGMDEEESIDVRTALTEAALGESDQPVYSDFAFTTAASSATTIWCPTAYRRFSIGARVAIHTWEGGRPAGAQTAVVQNILADRLTLTAGTALDGTFAAGSRVFPLARCKPLVDVPFAMATDYHVSVELEAREQEGAFTLPPRTLPSTTPTYKNWPVIALRPDWSEPPSFVVGRPVSQEAMGRSTYDRFLATEPASDHTLRWTWTTRATGWNLLSELESRRGRLLPFWVAGPQSIGTAIAINAGSIELDVDADVDAASVTLRHIAIETVAGTLILADVESVTEGDGTIVVAFVHDIERPLLSQVRRVTTAHLVRQQGDVLEEEWITDEAGTVEVEVLDTLDETFNVELANFAAQDVAAVDPLLALDPWIYLDSRRNVLNAPTPQASSGTTISNPANGTLAPAELFPGFASDVHFWVDVRWEADADDADDYRYLVPLQNIFVSGGLAYVRTQGATVAVPQQLTGLADGLPTLVRIAGLSHCVIAGVVDGIAEAGPWGAAGMTLFAVMELPSADNDPTEGDGTLFQWRDASGDDIVRIGRTSMTAQAAPASPEVTWSAEFNDFCDGRRHLLIYHLQLNSAATLWIDGNFVAQHFAPPVLPSAAGGNTRILRWDQVAGASYTQGDNLGLSSLLIKSEPMDTDPMIDAARELATRWGITLGGVFAELEE